MDKASGMRGLDKNFKDILESDQSLGSYLMDFQICEHCRYVSGLHGASPYTCDFCGQVNAVPRLAYTVHASNLLELIQDHYQLRAVIQRGDGTVIPKKEAPRHKAAIIIFFCTFVEVLLEKFLVALMNKQDIPKDIQKRLLEDNRYMQAKLEKLFPSLTCGESFKCALRAITKENKANGGTIDYTATAKFCKDIQTKYRNKIVHSGAIIQEIDRLADECTANLWAVICMFMTLHNRYVACIPTAGHGDEIQNG